MERKDYFWKDLELLFRSSSDLVELDGWEEILWKYGFNWKNFTQLFHGESHKTNNQTKRKWTCSFCTLEDTLNQVILECYDIGDAISFKELMTSFGNIEVKNRKKFF